MRYRVSVNVYDAAGQLLQDVRAYGTALQQNYAVYSYSLNGRRTSVTDGNGNRAEMSYDGFDRLSRWTLPSPATPGMVNPADHEDYTYDAAGNRLTWRKRDGSTLAFDYDNLNRMIRKTVPERPGLAATHTRDVFYGYDLRNAPLYARFDGHAGEGVTNAYDGFGRPTSSTLLMDGTSRTLGRTYDDTNNRLTLTYNEGQAVTYAFDSLGRLGQLFEGAGTATLLTQLSHNPQGLLAAREERYGSIASFGHDSIGRLTMTFDTFAGGTGTVSSALGYNPAGQITSTWRDNDAYAWTGAYNVNRNYAVNGLNQYTTTGPPSGPPTATFGYDGNGNLTSDGTNTYTYDVENRLVGRASNVTLRYDPLGRLYEVAGASGTTRFLHDGDALVAEYAAGLLTARYVHGTDSAADDPLIWYDSAGARHWLHRDHQGSITGITDGSGALQSINAYDEYGIPKAGNTGRFQYTGQAWLAELGMYYYKARIYSPTLGRFLQTDPVGYEDQINLYAYVGNDPINFTDPTGMCADRYKNGGCRVRVDRRTGEAGIRAGRELEGVLDRHDAQINALDPNSQHPVYDRQGNVIGNLTGQEIRAVWNGTHFSITSRAPNNGGAGGGITGAWTGNRFEGWARFTPTAVDRYARAAEQAGRGRQAGVSTLMFHDMAHETHMGNQLTNRYPVRATADDRRERPTSSIGEAMARSVGGDFLCGIAVCQ